MQVTSLAVVERVRSAGRGCVVARGLVSKVGECEAVWVEQRRGEAPWLGVPTRRGVCIFDFLVVAESAVFRDGLAKRCAAVAEMGCKGGWWQRRIARSDAGAPGLQRTEPSELHRAHR